MDLVLSIIDCIIAAGCQIYALKGKSFFFGNRLQESLLMYEMPYIM